jgi:hypothetical protein
MGASIAKEYPYKQIFVTKETSTLKITFISKKSKTGKPKPNPYT